MSFVALPIWRSGVVTYLGSVNDITLFPFRKLPPDDEPRPVDSVKL